MDRHYHWPTLRTIHEIFGNIYGQEESNRILRPANFHLQSEFDGDTLQKILAAMHAIWKCRCVLARRLTHHSFEDMCQHIRYLIEDPWLLGSPHVQSRDERRNERMRAPTDMPGWRIYNSDGASRAGNERDRQASCGALLRIDGVTVAELALYMGNYSNNEAEYEGIKQAIRHASRFEEDVRPVCLRVDSLLVARQLQGRWRCRAYHLHIWFEECQHYLQILQRRLGPEAVIIQHVYREFNASADALANAAIDHVNAIGHTVAVAINRNWF